MAAGHDCQPILFVGDAASGWSISKTLDAAASGIAGKAPPPPPPKSSAISGGPGRLNNEAFNRFKAADARGQAASASALFHGTDSDGLGGLGGSSVANHLEAVAGASVGADGELHTTHQNTITSIRAFAGDRGAVSAVSTSAVDGRLCVFDIKSGASVTGISKGVASLQV